MLNSMKLFERALVCSELISDQAILFGERVALRVLKNACFETLKKESVHYQIQERRKGIQIPRSLDQSVSFRWEAPAQEIRRYIRTAHRSYLEGQRTAPWRSRERSRSELVD